MKKTISAVMCAILILSMLLVMTGCGETGDKEKLLGTWKCEMDLAGQMNEEFAADESVAEYLSVDEFKLVVYMEFKEDDTFSMSVDEAQLDAAVDNLLVSITDGISRYMEDLMLEETGIEMSIDDILVADQTTMEELLAQMFPEESIEELKAEVIDSMQQEGKFKAEDGKLHTSAGLEYEVDPEVYETYTLEGNILTILEYVGSDADISNFNVYPMVFTKVN